MVGKSLTMLRMIKIKRNRSVLYLDTIYLAFSVVYTRIKGELGYAYIHLVCCAQRTSEIQAESFNPKLKLVSKIECLR